MLSSVVKMLSAFTSTLPVDVNAVSLTKLRVHTSEKCNFFFSFMNLMITDRNKQFIGGRATLIVEDNPCELQTPLSYSALANTGEGEGVNE